MVGELGAVRVGDDADARRHAGAARPAPGRSVNRTTNGARLSKAAMP
jgi:hypothetical protein